MHIEKNSEERLRRLARARIAGNHPPGRSTIAHLEKDEGLT